GSGATGPDPDRHRDRHGAHDHVHGAGVACLPRARDPPEHRDPLGGAARRSLRARGDGVIADFLVAGYAFWPVGVPLTAAGLTILVRRAPAVQRFVLEAGVVLMLAAAALLLVRVSGGDVVTTAFGGWRAPFGVTFVADRLSAVLATVTGLVALAVVIYARAEIGARRRRAGFDPLFLAMLAAVNGAFLTGDIFNLYVWFELMLVTALGLITLDRRRAQMDGAIRYAAMSMLGATFILLGVGLLYGEAGSLNMMDLAERLAGRPATVTLTASGYLLLAGFALKTGLFPLFFWLPASYHTAPIAALAAGLPPRCSLRVPASAPPRPPAPRLPAAPRPAGRGATAVVPPGVAGLCRAPPPGAAAAALAVPASPRGHQCSAALPSWGTHW